MPKVLFRVFFLICAALVIVIISALLGNYLKHKIEAAEEAAKHSVDSFNLTDNNDNNTVGNIETISMHASGINLLEYPSRDELLLEINRLCESCDTIILQLNGSNGKLIYSSPALNKLTRQPESVNNDENEILSLISYLVAAAKAKNTEICAVFEPSIKIESPENAAFIDSTIISELYSSGISRVMLKLPCIYSPDDDIDGLTVSWVSNYLSKIESGDCKIGVALNSLNITGSAGAKLTQNLSSIVSFMAVYFEGYYDSSDETYTAIQHELGSMVGIFKLYSLHLLIEDNDAAKSIYNAAVDRGINLFCFIGAVLPEDLMSLPDDENNDDSTDDDTKNETPADRTNPYASKASDYSLPESE